MALTLASSASFASNVDNKEGFWLFGGLGLGYQKLSTSATNTSISGTTLKVKEVAKSGFGGQLRSSASYYTEKIVYDLGLDYSYSRFSYKNYDPDPVASGSANNLEKVNHKMTIRNAVLELVPRYRFSDEFQIGPLLQYHFGGDVGHSEVKSVKKGSLIYLGGQGNYETPVGDAMLMRIGLQGLMGMNEAKRRNLMLNVFVDLGFALTKDSRKPQPVAEEKWEPEPEPEPAPPVAFQDFSDDMPSAISKTPGEIVVRLPSDKFLFDTAMSHIRSRKTRQYLRDYGKILGQNSDQWEKLTVEGHTDRRGSRKMNKELSTGRARTVYNHLIEGGAPKEKLRYAGRGFDFPADKRNNPKAWAKNRRVELNIKGVKATPEMLEQVNELNQKYGYAPTGRR